MKMAVFLACLLLQPLLSTASSAQLISEEKERTAIQVTVYNSNLGLIRETRKMVLPVGEGELRFMDVASHILPSSVFAASMKHQEGFSVLEQTYEYDLMNEKTLLDRYVGREMKLVLWNETHDRKEEATATLLSNNEDQVFRIRDEIYLGHPGFRVLPSLPDNLVAKPTLAWRYSNSVKEAQELEVSYLTGGMNWTADYILLVHPDERSSDLCGWATVENRSGTTYKDAELKLVAGNVHRAVAARDGLAAAPAMEMKVARASVPQFEESPVFEYHTYDLKRRSTLRDNQSKQISFLDAENITIRKEFVVYGARFHPRKITDEPLRQPVNVVVFFRNTKENRLGSVLPAGVVRLYMEDGKGARQFIGEERISHVPGDEEVRLKTGEATDLIAERTQTDFRQLSSKLFEMEWETTLRNHKDKEVSIGLIEPLSGNWRILSNSHPFKKTSAFSVRFDVKVPGGGEAKVKYRVQVGL
ncbi:MAG: DUF4139 domain-containing protein [Desulfobacteraceae bacterium]|nr:MAG: DUF4139 domain-containing protein [Desulfobacteraceae bacterium]